MNPLGDYIIESIIIAERIRIDNLKSKEYEKIGKLEWSFESYYLSELCISNDWYAGVTPDGGYVIFWAPDSRWMFAIDKEHTDTPTRRDWIISEFPHGYTKLDKFWKDFILSGKYVGWCVDMNKTIDMDDLIRINVPKEAEEYLRQL